MKNGFTHRLIKIASWTVNVGVMGMIGVIIFIMALEAIPALRGFSLAHIVDFLSIVTLTAVVVITMFWVLGARTRGFKKLAQKFNLQYSGRVLFSLSPANKKGYPAKIEGTIGPHRVEIFDEFQEVKMGLLAYHGSIPTWGKRRTVVKKDGSVDRVMTRAPSYIGGYTPLWTLEDYLSNLQQER